MKNISKIIYIICLILSVAAIWIMFKTCHEESQTQSHLEKSGIHTYGVIFKKAKGSKGSIEFAYKFKVEDREYTGRFTGSRNWMYNLGDTIQLMYDFQDPQINRRIMTLPPSEKTKVSEVIIFLLLAIVIFLFAIWRSFYNYKHKKHEL